MSEIDPSSLDALYRSVANERRRHVIDCLTEAKDGTATLDELVDFVVEAETHSPPPDRDSVAVDLHHVQLPLLADAGVIEFDSEAGTVRYDGDPAVQTMIDASKSEDAEFENV